MKILEILSRHRNDFVWMGECSYCGHKERYGDGYADSFYCTQVAPGRHCPECDTNCFGDKRAQQVSQ